MVEHHHHKNREYSIKTLRQIPASLRTSHIKRRIVFTSTQAFIDRRQTLPHTQQRCHASATIVPERRRTNLGLSSHCQQTTPIKVVPICHRIPAALRRSDKCRKKSARQCWIAAITLIVANNTNTCNQFLHFKHRPSAQHRLVHRLRTWMNAIHDVFN